MYFGVLGVVFVFAYGVAVQSLLYHEYVDEQWTVQCSLCSTQTPKTTCGTFSTVSSTVLISSCFKISIQTNCEVQ